MKFTQQLILEELEKVDWMQMVKEDAAKRECNYIVNWHLTLQLKEKGFIVNTNLVNKFLDRYVKQGLLTKESIAHYCTQYTIVK